MTKSSEVKIFSSNGFKVRRLRLSRLLTQQELADMAEVKVEEVDAFENNIPLPLGIKRKIKGTLAEKTTTLL
ncbi:hypothetical protein ACFLWG_00575 [Chloroflexota bacterium]